MHDPTYVVMYDPKTKKQYYEHRAIWITWFGPIPKGHDIHHINGDPKDNRRSNLNCMRHKEHIRGHYGNYSMVGGQLHRKCAECGKFKPVTEFYRKSNKKGWRERCKPCYNIFDVASKKRRLKEGV